MTYTSTTILCASKINLGMFKAIIKNALINSKRNLKDLGNYAWSKKSNAD